MKPDQLVNDLQEVLNTASTPEFKAMALEAAAFLYDTQVEEFAIRLQNVISDTEDLDNSEIVAGVQITLRECLDDFLLDHRIQLSPDAPLSAVTKAAKAVLELPFWQETQPVIDICMEDAPAEDKLAELIKLVTGGEVTTIATTIENVHESFFKRLIQLLNNNVEDLDETELDEAQVSKLNIFKMQFGKTFAFQMIELGWRIGSPVSTYFNRAQSRLIQLNNQEMAKEIVAFLLMGSDTWFDPLAGWSNHSASLQLELNVQAQVTTEIRKILQETKGPDFPMRPA